MWQQFLWIFRRLSTVCHMTFSFVSCLHTDFGDIVLNFQYSRVTISIKNNIFANVICNIYKKVLKVSHISLVLFTILSFSTEKTQYRIWTESWEKPYTKNKCYDRNLRNTKQLKPGKHTENKEILLPNYYIVSCCLHNLVYYL
jgi:hypothetical protein